MSKHPVYGLLYIVLLPFAFIMGLGVVTSLPVALQAPPVLLILFLFGSAVIYTITSFVFYNKAIRQGRQCKASLRDWIRVNAIVSIVTAIMLLLECTVLILEPSIMQPVIEQMKSMQQINMTDVALKQYLLYFFYVFLVYSTVLLVHIIYTFVLLNKYKQYFGNQPADLDSFGQDV